MIEPIQGEGGFITPAPGFLPALQRWANEHNVLFIADEVQTGFCRTGQWFACEDEGIVPLGGGVCALRGEERGAQVRASPGSGRLSAEAADPTRPAPPPSPSPSTDLRIA